MRSPVDSVPSVHDWGLFVGSVPVSEAGGDAPSRHARATAERKEIVIGGLASRRTRLDSWVSQRRCRSDQIDLSTLTIDLTCEDADVPTGPNGPFDAGPTATESVVPRAPRNRSVERTRTQIVQTLP